MELINELYLRHQKFRAIINSNINVLGQVKIEYNFINHKM